MNPWLKVLLKVGPMVLGGFQATAPLAPVIVNAVADAEQRHDATGPDKKREALASVDRFVATYNHVNPTHPIDPDMARTIAALAIDPLITTVNTWARSPIDQPADASHK